MFPSHPSPASKICSRPASANYTKEWAPLVSSLAATERMAEKSTREKDQGNSGGVGMSKVFATSNAPAAETTRGVRGFAAGTGGAEMASMVAPAGW